MREFDNQLQPTLHTLVKDTTIMRISAPQHLLKFKHHQCRSLPVRGEKKLASLATHKEVPIMKI